MQYPRDWFAKALVLGAVDGPCRVHLEEPVTPEVLAVDAWVEPIPERARELDARGAVGRMCAASTVVEVFHPGATLAEVDWSMMRVTLLHDALRKAAAKAPGAARRKMPPRPWLWLVLTERAEGVIAAWKMRRMRGWPRGFYASVVARGPRLVAVAMLARTQETLLLRLMGSGAVRDAALEDLAALPEDAWERVVVEPLLRLLRRDLTHQGATIPIEEDEAMMNFREAIAEGKRLMAEDRQRWLEEGQKLGEKLGEERGEKRGEKRGARKAVAVLKRLSERRLGRELTAAERRSLAARFDSVGPDRLGDVVLDLAPDALAAWLADPDAR